MWWFCKIDYCIYCIDDLLNGFGFNNHKEIKNSEIFIPLFQTDIILLEKQFLQCRPINEQKEVFLLYELSYNKIKGGFDIAFKIYIEKYNLLEEWRIYEQKKLYNDAIIWCQNNDVPFK